LRDQNRSRPPSYWFEKALPLDDNSTAAIRSKLETCALKKPLDRIARSHPATDGRGFYPRNGIGLK
jgi:hypothetical protein